MRRQPGRYGAGFWVRKRFDGGGHDPTRIVAALARLPAVDLLQGVGDGMARDLGIAALTGTLTVRAMAGGAGDDAARGVAIEIDRRRGGYGLRLDLWNGQGRIVGRDLAPALLVQSLGDAGHGVIGTQA